MLLYMYLFFSYVVTLVWCLSSILVMCFLLLSFDIQHAMIDSITNPDDAI